MSKSQPPNNQSRGYDEKSLWRLAGMGGTLASEILGGALIGWLLDKAFGTDPVILIVGTITGVVVGMTTFIRLALKASKDAERRLKRK